MKTFKRSTALILCILLLAGAAPAGVFAGIFPRAFAVDTEQSIENDAGKTAREDHRQLLMRAFEDDGKNVVPADTFYGVYRVLKGGWTYTDNFKESDLGVKTLVFTDTDNDGKDELLAFEIVRDDHPSFLQVRITGYDTDESGNVRTAEYETRIGNAYELQEVEGGNNYFIGMENGYIVILSHYRYDSLDFRYYTLRFENGGFTEKGLFSAYVSRAGTYSEEGSCVVYQNYQYGYFGFGEDEDILVNGVIGSAGIREQIAALKEKTREILPEDTLFPLDDDGEPRLYWDEKRLNAGQLSEESILEVRVDYDHSNEAEHGTEVVLKPIDHTNTYANYMLSRAQKLRQAFDNDGKTVVPGNLAYSISRKYVYGTGYECTDNYKASGLGVKSLVYTDTDNDGEDELLVFEMVKDEETHVLQLRITGYDIDGSGKVLTASYEPRQFNNTHELYEEEGGCASFVGIENGYIVLLHLFSYDSIDFTYYTLSFTNGEFTEKDLFTAYVGGYEAEDKCRVYLSNDEGDNVNFDDEGKLVSGVIGSDDIREQISALKEQTRTVLPEDTLFPINDDGESRIYLYGDVNELSDECVLELRIAGDGRDGDVTVTVDPIDAELGGIVFAPIDHTDTYFTYNTMYGETVLGDVTGSVDPIGADGKVLANDARFVLRASAGLETLDYYQKLAADVNRDGKVLADDARQILRFSAQLERIFRKSDNVRPPEPSETHALLDKLANRSWTEFDTYHHSAGSEPVSRVTFEPDGIISSGDGYFGYIEGSAPGKIEDDRLVYSDSAQYDFFDIGSDSMIGSFCCAATDSYGILVPTDEVSVSRDLIDRFSGTVWAAGSVGENINLGDFFELYPVSSSVICGVKGDKFVFMQPGEDSCLAVVITRFETEYTIEESVSVETWTRVTDPADWRPAAKRFFESYEVPSGYSNVDFALMDISGDGIPEIVSCYGEWEVYYIRSIYAWDGAGFAEAYSYDYRGLALYDITPYKNTDTGEIEFWDLGRTDLTAEDLPGALDPMVGVADKNLIRIELVDGKIRAAESHDELRQLAVPDLSQAQITERLGALHDFHNSFYDNHEFYEMKVLKINSKGENPVLDIAALKDMVDAW